jgi:hypothetical protein
LIWEIVQREGGVDLWMVGLGLLFPCPEDNSPGARGGSARSRQIRCSSRCSRVLASSCFDLFGPVTLVARSLVDGPRGECG